MNLASVAALSKHEEPRWSFVLVMGALMTLASISTDLYLPALPMMSREFRLSPVEAQATLASFMTGMGVSQLFYGPLSDRVGRRRTMLLGVGIYIAGTAACGLANSIRMLIIARFVQAVGACSAHVVPRAMIRDKFALRGSAQVMSKLSVATGAAPMFGPLLGGYLSTVFHWRSVFIVPAIVALLIGSWIYYRIEETVSDGSMLRARSEPAIRSVLGLFTERTVMGFVLCGAFNASVFFAYLVSAPELLMGIYHIPPQRFGWVFATNAIGYILTNQLNARLLHHYDPLTILRAVRLPTILVAVVLVYNAYTNTFGMLGVLVPLFFALASGGVIGANTAACALNADPSRAGSISSLIGMLAYGLAALVSLLAGLFQNGTAQPMAIIILCSMIASAFSLFVIVRPAA